MWRFERVIIFRHTQSPQNLANRALFRRDFAEYRRLRARYTDPYDCSLSEEGYAQALVLRQELERLIENRKVICYRSSQRRAIETADLAYPAGVWCDDHRLRERNWGTWEKMVRNPGSMYQKWRGLMRATSDIDYALPGGESLRQKYKKVLTFVHEMNEKHPSETLLVATHGETLRLICLVLEGASIESYPEYAKRKAYNGHIVAYSTSHPKVGEMSTSLWRSDCCPCHPIYEAKPWEKIPARLE